MASYILQKNQQRQIDLLKIRRQMDMQQMQRQFQLQTGFALAYPAHPAQASQR